jgi:DNA-binding winged helix-turn-helix (wHTH) protein
MSAFFPVGLDRSQQHVVSLVPSPSVTIKQSTRVRFGSFELDLESGELCRIDTSSNGQKVILQKQPFRVLCVLINRAEEIASR